MENHFRIETGWPGSWTWHHFQRWRRLGFENTTPLLFLHVWCQKMAKRARNSTVLKRQNGKKQAHLQKTGYTKQKRGVYFSNSGADSNLNACGTRYPAFYLNNHEDLD